MAFPSNNNTDINSELFANLVTAAQFAAYENSVARQILTVFDAPVNTGKVLQVPVWAKISAEIITDESAATAKTTNTTSALITLTEHVVYNQITDMLRDSSYMDVMSQLGDQSGRAIAESLDTQAFAEFASLSGSTTAIAVANFSVDDIMDRVGALRANRLTGPFVAVVHPSAALALKKALTATTSFQANTNVGNAVLDNYFIGNIAGVAIYESPLVAVNGSTGVATCAVFSPSAIGHAMRGGIDMNSLYLPAARATDLVLKAVAGAKVLQADHGIIMNVDLVA
jgi:hypothetical protein